MKGATKISIAPASRLPTLAGEWQELWQRADATPFQAPAWLLPWSRQFGDDKAFAITLHRDDRLVALLPLVFIDDAHGRRLLPMGAGISDYLDGVFAPDLSDAEVQLLLRALAPWQAIDLPQLPPASPLARVAAPDGWADCRLASEPCPTLRLDRPLPDQATQTLGYLRRRAGKAGIRYQLSGDGNEGLALLATLMRLHAARWRRRAQAGIFADPRVAAFHTEAVPALAAAGLLRLHALMVRDEPVAVLYGLFAKGRAYYYIGGFDPELARLSLGTLATGEAIASAAREGATAFDFLRGQELYKYRWGAQNGETVGRRLRLAGAGQ
jgi:CelD/BcsL family acetyltransferase involved in cellulose biosynthesis